VPAKVMLSEVTIFNNYSPAEFCVLYQKWLPAALQTDAGLLNNSAFALQFKVSIRG
jgi:hypothetical protein